MVAQQGCFKPAVFHLYRMSHVRMHDLHGLDRRVAGIHSLYHRCGRLFYSWKRNPYDPVPAVCSAGPVSYTHLDVYKRQNL